VEVLVTKNLRPRKGIILHRVKEIPAFDICRVSGIPTTATARTLLDLGGVLPEQKVEYALEHALRAHDVTLVRLRWQVGTQGVPGKRGTACLKRLLAHRPAGYRPKRSPLELKVLRSLREGGFPEPVYEHEIITPSGGRLRPDFCYPDKKVAIECESYTYHGGRTIWRRDIERYRILRRMGWTVIQVTEEDLADETAFHHEVRLALAT
jgi:very-short-patch-repair endonuclease